MSTLPTTTEEQIDLLDIFIEATDELLASWFLEQVKKNGLGSSMLWSQKGSIQMNRKGPEQEAVKAAMLTIRFFCQSRTERASIENIDNLIQSLNVDQDLKDRFKTSRDNFNNYLHNPPNGVNFPSGSHADTRWDIFDTFLYGRFAHANPQKRRLVKQWEMEVYYDQLLVQFDLIALEFIKATSAMAGICRDVRAEIAK